MGLQNAFHFAVSCPHPQLLEMLADLKVHPDVEDHKQITPFNLASTKMVNADFRTTTHAGLVQTLIDSKVRVDHPDQKGRTPFLNYYSAERADLAFRLLTLGANVNQMDASGLFALKYALIRRNQDQIKQLVT